MSNQQSSKISPARRVALEVLRRVEAEGAYSSLALNHALLKQHGMSPEDRGLATELVYGTIRWRRSLDYVLATHSHRPLDRIEPILLRVLRLAAYQLLFLDRVPTFAAVDQATEMARTLKGRRSGNFVNGVLRMTSANKDHIEWPNPEENPARALGVRYSFPDWMSEWWIGRFGVERCAALMAAINQTPPLWARVNTSRITTDRFLSLMSASGFSAEASEIVPDAVQLKGIGDLSQVGAFEAGLFHIQDAAAQTVCQLVDPRPGQRVLDACCAPGGKTATLAQLMNGDGELVAADAHPARVGLVRKLLEQLGSISVQVHNHDLTRALPAEWGQFDRVLVDAPCSSLGVIRRHPETKWRMTMSDVQHLASIQKEILEQVAQAVKPGGNLIYSVCTFTAEETTDLISRFLTTHPEFKAIDPRTSKRASWHTLVAEQGQLSTWPDIHNMDTFFAVRLVRSLDAP